MLDFIFNHPNVMLKSSSIKPALLTLKETVFYSLSMSQIKVSWGCTTAVPGVTLPMLVAPTIN